MERKLKGLDAYITGANIHYEEAVPHKCPKCGAERQVQMFYEWGGWFYQNDDDSYCGSCKVEMDIIEK